MVDVSGDGVGKQRYGKISGAPAISTSKAQDLRLGFFVVAPTSSSAFILRDFFLGAGCVVLSLSTALSAVASLCLASSAVLAFLSVA